MTGTVYGRLQDSGFFFDPVQREIEQQVMPWLKEETEKIVARHATARYHPLPLVHCTSTYTLTLGLLTRAIALTWVLMWRKAEHD